MHENAPRPNPALFSTLHKAGVIGKHTRSMVAAERAKPENAVQEREHAELLARGEVICRTPSGMHHTGAPPQDELDKPVTATISGILTLFHAILTQF